MKRILSVVLSVIMTFSAMSVSFGAYASEQTRGGGLYVAKLVRRQCAYCLF